MTVILHQKRRLTTIGTIFISIASILGILHVTLDYYSEILGTIMLISGFGVSLPIIARFWGSKQ